MQQHNTWKELLSLENNPSGDFVILQKIEELSSTHEWAVVGRQFYEANKKQFLEYEKRGSYNGTLEECLRLKDKLSKFDTPSK